ncbi:SDR family NAD(P)-dependent oxidoreductase [Sphaerochaeta globosa]|uniref:Short-chain dehydrogenase/reductase SDR n=1 Tax=Sphaerochaeta globosa (strain ATCC BAA-1886 / DSM 22777 / Buddy) TaxID=158189 RepID=F0RWS3_SPHGB|nr:SDR family NAD(P)-dependent oxidoreductase [Sphaerochaeta globosa]ADY13704.1 short-chain dehydrogenase/reductase SDR [Sphaerochaeta globosa str. Buddy]
MNPYWKQYEWSNIRAMLKNNKAMPKQEQKDLQGHLVVITGATSGIGYETARLYASHGADLLMINRNKEKSEKLKAGLEQQFKGVYTYFIADFSKLEAIHAAADFLCSLDRDICVLIHNAGVYNTKKRFTHDDIEEVFQVNYLASFMLTYRLQDKLKRQKHARILYVNSEGHRFALAGLKLDDLGWDKQHYTGLKSYGSAKTAQLLSLFFFSRIFKDTNVTINAMHPGDVLTNMGENNGRLYKFFKHRIINPSSRSPQLSAQALYYLGVSQEVKEITGKFFNLTTLEIPAPHALDVVVAEQLWAKSLEMAKIQVKSVDE